jgi:hypothetical protein
MKMISGSNFKGHHGLIVGAVLGVAATAAYYRAGADTSAAPTTLPAPPLEGHQDDPSGGSVLPPNHPPIGAGSAMGHGGGMGGPGMAGGGMAAEDDAPSISWKLPDGWQVMPNTSSMRLATYKVTGKDGDADVSVTRAGGDTDSNIQRWVDQFGGTAKPVKTEKKVAGYKVTVVELTGTYAGGGMGGPSDTKSNWALMGAIIETPGAATFFKMNGPESTVTGARASFNKLVDGITAAAPTTAPSGSTARAHP